MILDTNVLIDYERGTIDREALDDDDLAIAALTVAEYRTGIELADTSERAAARSRALAAMVEVLEVLEYTEATAVHHARLIAHARRSGRSRGAHDLIIAAHAAQTGRLLLSRDAQARFGDLPSVIASQP
ncbi:type II toxin-antitoxin system VapC family toxin [Agrococcus beijingensis]|uniref:type II toxin-antitoxin system VapC family toxin n=1 Tax=Agrococcus beijingensis TaxID=3068634 RepID=UPI002742140C|nr:PIN domain-containing protein [Agrococcus sp. REN33]